MRNRTLASLFVLMPLALVLTGCPHDAKPDIVAGTISVSPTAPVPTVPATISLPVSNHGEKDAGPFSWTVTRDGVQGFATGQISGLAQNATTTISFTDVSPVAISHSYLVILNSSNNFQESDLQNNTASAVIGYGPTSVDPQVTQLVITTPSGTPSTGQIVTLTATIDSPIDATNTITDLSWTLTGIQVESANPSNTFATSSFSGVISSIAPGQIFLQDIVIGALDDRFSYTYTFTVTVGPTNADTNPANNSASTITIAPTPSARAALPQHASGIQLTSR